MGAPTIIIYDPQTDAVVKQWGGDLYDLTPQELIKQLNYYR